MTKFIAEELNKWRVRYSAHDVCVAHLLCDEHDPSAIAFTFVDRDLKPRDLSYGELASMSRQLAGVLHGRGVREGDRVAVLLGKRVELIVTLLAIWRLGAVHLPLFTAFATPAIRTRVEQGGARMLITEPAQAPKVESLSGVQTMVTGPDWDDAVATAEPWLNDAVVGGHGEIIRIFTSGTTGPPKAVSVPVKALASFASYLHYGLDLVADDVYWNAADPGWAYGLYYAVVAPLAIGRRSLLLDAGFSAELMADVIDKFGVTNLAAAPTAYRGLARLAGREPSALRVASSAGEPLTADVVEWSTQALGVEVRDQFGQTEHGMVIVNGWHPDIRRPTRNGSMGFPLPGFSAAVIDDNVALSVEDSELMWFSGYVDAPAATAERFSADGKWYFTGDLGQVDDDGYFLFTSRDDDIILMAGYRIAPFDVENALSSHAAVSEVAVVGHPDPMRGEVVVAFVVLEDGRVGSQRLIEELQTIVRTEYAAHAYPRRIYFVDGLPKTPSGKVQRNVLRKVRDDSRPSS